MKKLYLLAVAPWLYIQAHAQTLPVVATQPVAKGNYLLASKYSTAKLKKMVFSTSVDAHWLKLSDRFWYSYETSNGKRWYIVDPASRNKKLLFDNASLAAEITMIIKDPFDAQHLPINNLKFTKDEKSIQFDLVSTIDQVKKDRRNKKAPDSLEKKTFYFQYNLQTLQLQELKNYEKVLPKPMWAAIAPDSSAVIFSRKFNLYWMDKANYKKALKNENDSTVVEHQLTKEGVENYAFGGRGMQGGDNDNTTNDARTARMRQPAQVLWSPDSKHFAMIRTDQRKVKDIWVINSLSMPRPTLETQKYQLPGEKENPIKEMYLFDFPAKTYKKLNVSLFKDQELTTWAAPQLQKNRDDEFRPNLWLGTKDKFYFFRTGRDLKRIDVCYVDINTGQVKPVIEERLNTYIDITRPGLIAGGKELVEWSERDGWAHFYLYDGYGKLESQITKGSFHCDDIVNIDEKNRVLYFTAQGVNPTDNPYYVHMYRINLDGTHMEQINAGNYDFAASSQSDDGHYVVSTYSRVNTVPKSTLYDFMGHKLMDLETADLSGLMASGYKFPEPFKVKADDGITDLYGVMYKPFDFDPTKKYPIIEYVYPGPQTEAVNAAFSASMNNVDRLAQLGFIVVTVGNRGGNPERSKWYHNFGYGNLRDYGLPDKKAAVEQLADRYPFIDINKAGITGHSGGGFMSTAAILSYPDFFKVAVSESGNHDNSIYNRWWSEKHDGVKESVVGKDTTFLYDIDKNQDLAKNLKGHLMLSTGDIDNNVSPSNTIRVINALIKANKRFDYVLLPGQRHAYGDMTEYFFWRKADYFVQYLLGDFSQPVDMLEMQRDIELDNKVPPAATGGAGRRGQTADQ